MHTRPLREAAGSGKCGVLARRNPLLLFRLPVVFLLRLADRKFCGLLFQEPPRRTRSGTGQASTAGSNIPPRKRVWRKRQVSAWAAWATHEDTRWRTAGKSTLPAR